MKLWQKNNQTLDSFIESFETKDDLVLDQKLAIYDVYGSLAHAKMLEKIGILSSSELAQLKEGLKMIIGKIENNEFNLQQGDEDIHTKIENYLTSEYGTVGKKIHTGRSRNDQVLTAIRLYTKDKLLEIWEDLLLLTESFQTFSKIHETVPMPGFTHMQKAMPSTVGMWANAFVEGLLDDVSVLHSIYNLNDQSPLGSAAGYGVPLPLDREYSAELLGFKKVQSNSVYCQNSRGKIEAQIISSFISVLFDINKFATDVLFFTSSDMQYFDVTDNCYSGSSIMPQKKNVDIAELLRSKVHLLLGNYTQIISLSSNLISGYNRDLQDSKKPFFESLEITHDSIKAATILVNSLIPNKEKLESALTTEIFATHQAMELVAKGIPFRQAYQMVGNNLDAVDSKDTQKLLQLATHSGGTGNLGLDKSEKEYQNQKNIWEQESKLFKDAMMFLLGNERLQNAHVVI